MHCSMGLVFYELLTSKQPERHHQVLEELQSLRSGTHTILVFMLEHALTFGGCTLLGPA